jgi:hypothetical protein
MRFPPQGAKLTLRCSASGLAREITRAGQAISAAQAVIKHACKTYNARRKQEGIDAKVAAKKKVRPPPATSAPFFLASLETTLLVDPFLARLSVNGVSLIEMCSAAPGPGEDT